MAPKRKLDDILAELPSREALDARIQLLQPSSRPPQLHLPSSLDIDSPYALFTLFISEDTIQYISQSTNEYAQRKQASDTSESSPGRYWKDTTVVDIKIFLGILIYMGIHRSPRIESYWCQEHDEPLHTPRRYMPLKRFQQIKRFLHISRYEADISYKQRPKDKRWWYKLEPLASLWESAAQRYYQVGSNLSIDETMIRCFGRSSHTIKMPSKPIEKGYKIFALAEHGYIWAFT